MILRFYRRGYGEQSRRVAVRLTGQEGGGHPEDLKHDSAPGGGLYHGVRARADPQRHCRHRRQDVRAPAPLPCYLCMWRSQCAGGVRPPHAVPTIGEGAR